MMEDLNSKHIRSKTLWFTSLYTLFASLVVVAANFITNVLVIRMLGPVGNGNYALIISTGLVLMVVVGQSLSTGLAYVVSRNRPDLGSLVVQLVGIGTIQFIFAFGLLWVLQNTILSNAFLPSGSNYTILFLAALLPVVQNLGEFWRIILISHQEAVKANQVVMVQRLLQVFFISIMAAVCFWDRVQFSFISVIGLIIISFLMMNILFIKYLSPYFSFGGSGINDVFVFSIPCYLGDLFKALNYRMDVFFVSFFQNPGEVGFYSAAAQTANLILLVANAFATNLLPRIASSQKPDEDNAHRTAQIVRIIFWFNLFCAFGLGSVSFWLLPFLYTAVFINSVPSLLLILPGTWLLSLTFILASYINGIGKTRINLYISMISFVITLILDISLIPRFSIAGASIASSIAYSIGAVLSMAYFIWQTKLPVSSLCKITGEDISQLKLIIGHFRK